MSDVFLEARRRQNEHGTNKLLFGRTVQLERIHKAITDTLSTQQPRGILVHGYSGLGKTRLVEHALHKFFQTTHRATSTTSTNSKNRTSSSSSFASTTSTATATTSRRPRAIFVSGRYDKEQHEQQQQQHASSSSSLSKGNRRPYLALIEACCSLFLCLAECSQQPYAMTITMTMIEVDNTKDDTLSLSTDQVVDDQTIFLQKVHAISKSLESILQNDETLFGCILPEIPFTTATATTTATTTRGCHFFFVIVVDRKESARLYYYYYDYLVQDK
jgi:AAA ATPase domain